MFAGWLKKFMARMLSSTAAVALGVGAAATTLAPGSAQATVITTAGGGTPQTATQVGTTDNKLFIGDSISQFGVTLPEYWEFTWGGPTAESHITSSGSFGSVSGSGDFGNLELYSVAGGTPGNWDASLQDYSAFAIESFGSFGSASADLGTVPLTIGDEYVVGISSGDAEFSIDFNATVPEPGSLSLLGSAFAALGFARWRRRLRA
jgi:hypothetical protein